MPGGYLGGESIISLQLRLQNPVTFILVVLVAFDIRFSCSNRSTRSLSPMQLQSPEEFAESLAMSNYTIRLGGPLRCGLEKFRRAKGFRSTADACRELLSVALAQSNVS